MSTQAKLMDKAHVLGCVARVGLGVTRDRISRRKAIRLGDVPASVEQITPEWLTAVMCKDHPGAKVLDFDDAWQSYRQHSFCPCFCWAYTRAGAGSMQPDFQPDYVCNDIMTRTAHAVSDLEALKAVSRS